MKKNHQNIVYSKEQIELTFFIQLFLKRAHLNFY